MSRQHFLYFLPLPHGHGSLAPGLLTGGGGYRDARAKVDHAARNARCVAGVVCARDFRVLRAQGPITVVLDVKVFRSTQLVPR